MSSTSHICYLVEKLAAGELHRGVVEASVPSLRPGQVHIRVSHSSLNYKDAMAATGHPGIVKTFPHVPGVDAVGVVEESLDSRFRPGDEVLATGHELGVERWGGWASFLVSPAEWLVPLPQGLTAEESMILGTAGFTAAQCVKALIKHGCRPEAGRIIVSGATGGVGSLSVMLLAHLGFNVTAVTGKTNRHAWLQELGASEIVGRDELTSDPKRPLLKGEFSGGIDTVGGNTLSTMLKKIAHRGGVACCGVAGGAELATTVYPFILRGIALYGIDSAWCPDDLRLEIWQSLAGDWKLPFLDQAKVDLHLETIDVAIAEILQGNFAGRGVIQLATSDTI